MGRYIKGNVNELLNIGTLAAATVVAGIFDNVVDERTLVSSIVATWTVADWTPIADVGPLVVGVAHSDYSAAEILAVVQQTASWTSGDKVAQELNRRQIRIVGTVAKGEGSAIEMDQLNEGRPIKTKLNWMINTGQSLQLFAFNTGSAAFSTTDPDLRVDGHANLWPR